MKISVILISAKREECDEALLALANADFPAGDIEIIVAQGQSPSAQRNEAAKRASGEFLLFLDNDSLIHPKLFHYYADALAYENGIGVVGGPALHRSEGSRFQRAVAEVLSSPLALGPFHARYTASGLVRPTTERELILCNMLIRRDLFQQEGGFHPELYPNEENEFLNRVQAKTKIYFHPLATCFRAAPSSPPAFVHKMFRYGAGRAKHMLLFPRFRDKIFLVPTAFAFLVLSVPFLSAAAAGLVGLLFLAYAALGLFAALYPALRERRPGMLILMPLLFFCCHLSYGVGLLCGLLRQPFLRKSSSPNVSVTCIKEFDGCQGRAAEIG
jgi:succinoglycan biosynthesis protein ExoA